MKNIYLKIAEAVNGSDDTALCTVVNTRGSTPRKTGAKMLVYPNGAIYGSIGGGAVERSVIKNAMAVLADKTARLFRHDLLQQHSMCCGGVMDIYIESIMKKNRLYLFGAGHIGQALLRYAVNFDFEVVLIDDRKEFIDQCTVPSVNKMNLPYTQALGLLPFNANTYICIMTHSHMLDREILAFCIDRPHAYLGMIGSERKVEMTKKMFQDGLNISAEKLEEVDMPMGMDIAAEDPEEIALSILAKLIEVKNKLKEKVKSA